MTVAAGCTHDQHVGEEIYRTRNNRFDYNIYYLGMQSLPFRWEEQDRNVIEWQNYGHDLHGSFE